MGAEHACVVVTRWAPRAWKTVGVPRSRSRGAVSGAPRRRRARARVMAPRVAPPAAGPDSYKVWEIKTQARKGTSKEDDARARELLERTAWQVQPIMRKRGWRVGVLLEMPAKVRDRLGDNYNRGERVRLTLRRDDGAWEAYEQVLAVMLHELVHNAIGPHDGKFFALLAELEKECEDLMARGIGGTGAGFDAKGTRLGHRGSWGGIETRDAKTAAIDAARRRAAQQVGDGAAGRPATRRRRRRRPQSPRSAAAELLRSAARGPRRSRRSTGSWTTSSSCRTTRTRTRTRREEARARSRAATKRRRKEKSENRRVRFRSGAARRRSARVLTVPRRGRTTRTSRRVARRRRRGRPPRRGEGNEAKRTREKRRARRFRRLRNGRRRRRMSASSTTATTTRLLATPRDAARPRENDKRRGRPRARPRRRGSAARVLCGTRSPIRTARRATGGVFPGRARRVEADGLRRG